MSVLDKIRQDPVKLALYRQLCASMDRQGKRPSGWSPNKMDLDGLKALGLKREAFTLCVELESIEKYQDRASRELDEQNQIKERKLRELEKMAEGSGS